MVISVLVFRVEVWIIEERESLDLLWTTYSLALSKHHEDRIFEESVSPHPILVDFFSFTDILFDFLDWIAISLADLLGTELGWISEIFLVLILSK